MNESNANIHTEFHRLLGTEAKEALLQQRGLVVWMYGMSGSGKSTLFRMICGLIHPQRGEVRCSLRPALVFQNPDHQLLLPSCSSELLLNLPPQLSRSKKLERKEYKKTMLKSLNSSPLKFCTVQVIQVFKLKNKKKIVGKIVLLISSSNN